MNSHNSEARSKSSNFASVVTDDLKYFSKAMKNRASKACESRSDSGAPNLTSIKAAAFVGPIKNNLVENEDT